jgi:neutral ceramidase
MSRGFGLAMAVVLTSGLSACGSSSPADTGAVAPFADPQLAQCVIDSPMRQVGAGLNAPSLVLDVPVPPVGRAAGECADNNRFHFGSGIFDVTGPVALKSGAGWEDPTQVMRGIHQRQFARAYAIASPCNEKRVMFVSADIGLMWGSLRTGVLDAIAGDPVLSTFYSGDNLMLSATHTHGGPAGYSHTEAGNALHLGYDDLVYQTIVNGMVEAIRRAHANIEANPQAAPIRLASGELLNTNINRSRPAYEANPETERAAFLDVRGEEVDVNKRVVQLNLVRDNGNAVGLINWFGVHPTVIGPEADLVSSDCKGFASLGFERIMRTRYDVTPGNDTFVAAFAQADEGDSSPNIFINEFPHPDPRRGGGEDIYESNAISGTKQLAKALELWNDGTALRGPVDYRFMHVKMNEVVVTDPAILARLQHPAELDSTVKQTCNAALGVSFPAGAEDGPGPIGYEGIRCGDDPAIMQSIVRDFAELADFGLPLELVSNLLLCNLQTLPLLGMSCHAEKPILLPTNLGEALGGLPQGIIGDLLGAPLLPDPPSLNFEVPIQPFQIFRIGNLAVVGLPWEVTTTAARRIRSLLLEELAPVGIDTVVVAGLVNDFVHYLTTREEYATQQYEGASTVYGPWSLAAVKQETRRLALSLRDGGQPDAGPAYPRTTPVLRRVPYIPFDPPGGTAFGEVVADAPPTVAPGEIVSAVFQAGHPRNNLMTQDSFVFAERLNADGEWEIVARDRDPELRFIWDPAILPPLPLDSPLTGPSTAEAAWHIPRNTPEGTYRLRHQGEAVPGGPYEGISSPFTVSGAVALCP